MQAGLWTITARFRAWLPSSRLFDPGPVPYFPEPAGGFPAAPMTWLVSFQEAMKSGVHRTVHAGEAGPAERVKEVRQPAGCGPPPYARLPSLDSHLLPCRLWTTSIPSGWDTATTPWRTRPFTKGC